MAEPFPYLARAVAASGSVSERLVDALEAARQSRDALEAIRELGFSVAALDRQLSAFTVKLIERAGGPAAAAAVHPLAPLPQQFASLRGLIPPDARPGKHLPPGGMVSLLYHIISVLEEAGQALDRLSARRIGPWSSGLASFGLLGLSAALVRWRNARLVRLVPRWLVFLLGLAAAKGVSALWQRTSAVAQLQRVNAQLLVLIRMWLVAADTFHSAQQLRRADQSYAVMLPAVSRADVNDAEKPLARRLLESSALPAAAAIWPSLDWRFGLMKRGLDITYAAMEPGWYVGQAGGFLGQLLAVPFTLAAGGYYLARPDVAAERTAAIMMDPPVDFISHVWRMLDSPLARGVATAIARSRVALVDEAPIEGVRCGVVSSDAGVLEVLKPSPLPVAGDHDRAQMFAAAPPLPLRVSLPPTLMMIHGGGFVGCFWANDCLLTSQWVRDAAAAAAAAGAHRPIPQPGSSSSSSSAGFTAAPGPSGMLVIYPHYTLSPEARYPTALNQLVAVYRWLRPRTPRLVVSGESAGGNLAAALVLRLLVNADSSSLPVGPTDTGSSAALLPDALVLGYPSLCLNPSPSPSRALHINDILVPMRLLNKLAGAYIGRQPPDEPSAPSSAALASAAAAAAGRGGGSVSVPSPGTLEAALLLSSEQAGDSIAPTRAQSYANLAATAAAAAGGVASVQRLPSIPSAAEEPTPVEPSTAGPLGAVATRQADVVDGSAVTSAGPSVLSSSSTSASAAHGRLQPLRLPQAALRGGEPMASATAGDATDSPDALSLDTPADSSDAVRAVSVPRDDGGCDDVDRLASGPSDSDAAPSHPAPPRRRLFDYTVTTSMFIHPLYAPDDVLRRFPPTDIVCGGLDPLLDDAIDFNTRLRRLGVGGELVVHRALPHGFLNFAAVPAAAEGIASVRACVLGRLGVGQ